jgi:hypothetical protein
MAVYIGILDFMVFTLFSISQYNQTLHLLMVLGERQSVNVRHHFRPLPKMLTLIAKTR